MKDQKFFTMILIFTLLLLLLSNCSKKTTEPEVSKVANPIFSIAGGSYSSAQIVSITCATNGATIRYTINGSDPNEESLLYSSPIEINQDTALKARAYKEHWTPSEIATKVYIVIPENFVLVEGGTFNNGVSDVTVSSFSMDKYPITQADYLALMGSLPSTQYGNGSEIPVYQVSWYNTVEYCNRRSMQEGLTPCYSYGGYGNNIDDWRSDWASSYTNHTMINCNWNANGYRLPTEMEWMFAARGGNHTHDYTYSGSNDLDPVGWYMENSPPLPGTNPVGTKSPNELGLYDMSGNVWEWVWDIYGYYPSSAQTNPTGAANGNQRTWRGGAYAFEAIDCTVSARSYDSVVSSYFCIGFRVCRSTPES